jgi:hypothetical protein
LGKVLGTANTKTSFKETRLQALDLGPAVACSV